MGAVPKVLDIILSLELLPEMPQTQIDLSGIFELGKMEFIWEGAVEAFVEKVKIPEVETLNDETACPLNKKVKGMDCTVDQEAEVWPPPLTRVQLDGNPPPTGYSKSSVLIPFGLPLSIGPK